MKKIFLILPLLISLFSFSQNLKTDKYEVYLNDYIVNEVNISKGMYMTQNMQYFYEGKIEVNYLKNNSTKVVQFFFSVWDNSYKELIIKDMKFNSLSPQFSFTDNNTIEFTDESGKVVTKKIKDSSSYEYAALSGVLAWLETTIEEDEPVKNDKTELESAEKTEKKVKSVTVKKRVNKDEPKKDTFESKLAAAKKKNNESFNEEEVNDEPIVEKPVIEKPVNEKPVEKKSAIDKPIVEKPVGEKPVVNEPVIEEPVGEKPVISEPVIEKPVGEKPVVSEPVIEKPVGEKPVVSEPVIEKPVGEKPVVSDPATEKPVIDKLEDVEPVDEKPIEEKPQGESVPIEEKPTESNPN